MSSDKDVSAEEELPDKKERPAAQRKKKQLKQAPKNEDDDDESIVKRRRSFPRKRRAAPKRGAAARVTDAKENSDFDPSDEEQPKKVAKKVGGKSKFGCPHCEKSFTSEGGLKYHVDNYVCRVDECSEARGTKRRRRGKNKGDTSSGTPNKRFRGKLENRTCPHCQRVFTSTLGMNYHASRKVCQQPEKTSATLFPTLLPGDRFVTAFGVVEVVKDDRGTPTALATEVTKEKLRSYQSSKAKVEKQGSKMLISKAIRFRARRGKINALFDKKNVNQASIFHAYFGANPSTANENKQLSSLPQPLQDPTMPLDSFPHRMVECVWFQEGESRQQKTPQRLFLRRQLLTEPFAEGGGGHICTDCGQRFSSVPGYKYHSNNTVCIQKKIKSAEARKAQEKQVEVGAKHILDGGHVPPEYTVGEAKPDFTKRKGHKKKRSKKKKETAMYPEVLMSLGFKVVRENMSFTESMLLPSLAPSNYDDASEIEVKNDIKVDPPDALLNHLKQRLIERQRVSDDQKYGSMYAEVYKALGFKRQRKQKSVGSVNRRRRSVAVKPAPPIIDVSALADEIDSGRYPSKKRYTGDDHADVCFICKDGGSLLCCDFCSNAVHMHCISEKFTIKTPEPDEDFMCHKCIQIVLQRRKRAEGRRLKKQEREEIERQEEKKKNPDIKSGMEYEHLATKGQDFGELVELLHDARLRLRQSLATSKLNDLRRKLMSND